MMLKKFDKFICEKLIKKLIDSGNNQTSIWITYIKRVFDYDVYLELLPSNYMREAYIPKIDNKPIREIRFYEKKELVDFLEFSKNHRETPIWSHSFTLLPISVAEQEKF